MDIKTLVIRDLDLDNERHFKFINNLPLELENLIIENLYVSETNFINNLPISLKYFFISEIDDDAYTIEEGIEIQNKFWEKLKLPFCCELKRPNGKVSSKCHKLCFKYINGFHNFYFDSYTVNFGNGDYFYFEPITISKCNLPNDYNIYIIDFIKHYLKN